MTTDVYVRQLSIKWINIAHFVFKSIQSLKLNIFYVSYITFIKSWRYFSNN